MKRRDTGRDDSSGLRLDEGVGHCHGSSGSSSGGGGAGRSGAAYVAVAGHQPNELGVGEDLLLGAADGLGGDTGESPSEQLPHEGREFCPFEEEREDLLAEERLVENDNGFAIGAPRGGALECWLLAAFGGGVVHHQSENVRKASIGLIVGRVIFR